MADEMHVTTCISYLANAVTLQRNLYGFRVLKSTKVGSEYYVLPLNFISAYQTT